MCPACITTLALAVGGTGSAGGLTAWIVSRIFRRKRSREPAPARSTSQPGGAP